MQIRVTEINQTAALLKILGDKTRLTMIKMLNSHDCCVCEFVEIFQTSQPGISQHLRRLKDVELVKESRKGQWVMYSLNKESEFYPLINDLIQHLPDQNYRIKELEEKGIRISCE
ncbi:ArsR/SmtB family transcription factor [Bacillus sp. 2205SS5-2]|uniref:ArsR/SmtB family transcription factor n=1 Tax=Bacillus sp. 2205SS5-2 TaxID=3109031 RepID=UPI003007C686